jgi:hypothetical protein
MADIFKYCIFVIVIIILKPITLYMMQVMLEESNIVESIINFLLFQNAQLLSQL